jgi:hypothetical protein
MYLEQLIKDLKEHIETAMEAGTPCEVCLQDDQTKVSHVESECEDCEFDRCKTLSGGLRTYMFCGAWYTDSWREYAFSVFGADLSPDNYGYEGCPGDDLTKAEEEKLNAEMEAFCKRYENSND